jgi:hypothetical protein
MFLGFVLSHYVSMGVELNAFPFHLTEIVLLGSVPNQHTLILYAERFGMGGFDARRIVLAE